MTSTNIDSCYVLKFGKYKNMLGVDVADIQTVNKKGEYENTGLKYLHFYVNKTGLSKRTFYSLLYKTI